MTANQTTILSIHYLPCTEWFKHFVNDTNVLLEQHEHYVKQSYRNRCVILSANGPLALTIPVKKKGHNQPVHSIEIENDFKWQKQHWEAIRSAYNSSPYFMYYEHHFTQLYIQQFQYLQEFNVELIRLCLKLMKVEKELVLNDTYITVSETDYRNTIHPKIKPEIIFKPYLQVFSEKFSFQSNLSIVDLLFNQGPEAIHYL